jgi:hypothetical protein
MGMKRILIHAAVGFGVLAGAGLGLAGAASAAGSADSVVNGLQTEGYLVTLNQTPTAPLSSCTVSNVDKSLGGTSAYVDLVCPTGC